MERGQGPYGGGGGSGPEKGIQSEQDGRKKRRILGDGWDEEDAVEKERTYFNILKL